MKRCQYLRESLEMKVDLERNPVMRKERCHLKMIGKMMICHPPRENLERNPTRGKKMICHHPKESLKRNPTPGKKMICHHQKEILKRNPTPGKKMICLHPKENLRRNHVTKKERCPLKMMICHH